MGSFVFLLLVLFFPLSRGLRFPCFSLLLLSRFLSVLKPFLARRERSEFE